MGKVFVFRFDVWDVLWVEGLVRPEKRLVQSDEFSPFGGGDKGSWVWLNETYERSPSSFPLGFDERGLFDRWVRSDDGFDCTIRVDD